jgi:TRAP-type uncharacterized transport system fused permease subunit
MKHVPSIWKTALPPWSKVQATLHLTGYCIHLLMLSLCFLYPLLLAVSQRYPDLLSLFGFMAVFNLAGLAPTLLFTTAQQQLKRRWWTLVPVVLLLSLLGAGMMLTTARAAWQSLSQRPGDFERTPKFGLGKQRRDWLRLQYQPPLDKIVFAEFALSAFNLHTSYTALTSEVWTVALYTGVFGLGLAITASLTVGQALSRWWQLRFSATAPVVVPASAIGEP